MSSKVMITQEKSTKMKKSFVTRDGNKTQEKLVKDEINSINKK